MVDKRELEKRLARLRLRRRKLFELMDEVDKAVELINIRDRALKDFYYFCTEVMGFKDLYEPLHRPLCDLIANDKIKRKLILLPRGHFKTTIVSICYPLWRLIQDTSRRIALCSKAAAKAEENLDELVDRAGNSRVQAFFGEIIGHPDTWPIKRKDRIKLRREGSTTGPSIAAYSVESSEVGRHFDCMIFDDIVDQEMVNSQRTRDAVWEWFGRQLSVLDPGAEIIVIGTIWHWDDVYIRIQKQLKRYDENHRVGWYVYKRKAIERGRVIFPTRFTKDELDEIRKIQGDYIFSCFYMNEPTGSGMNPFDLRRFVWEDYKPVPGAHTYILIDPASTRQDYSSYSGIIVGDAYTTREGRKVFTVRDAFLEKLHPDVLIDRIFTLAKTLKPFRVIIEDEAYQKSLYYWLRRDMIQRGFHFPIQMIKNPRNVSQEMRLVSLQPFVHNGAITFSNSMSGKDDLITEFESFPKGPHKDLICALYFATHIIAPAAHEEREVKRKVPVRARTIQQLVERPIRRNGRMPLLRIGGR